MDPVSVAGVPASGSSFAVGTTAVNVTGQSGDGQLATCSFDVTVTYTPVVVSPTEPSEPTFGQIMAGIRPRGFGAIPYTLRMPAAGRIAYYVSTTGSDTNLGTSTAPFRTINKAAQVALAGDVVTIKSGTYSETVTVKNGGTLSAPIVFQAEVHGGVVMSGGRHFFQPINWSLGINNTGAIYVTVRGLVFRNYTYLGETGTQATYDALRAARGWRIEDCLFDSPGENAVNLRGDDITLTRNTLQLAGRHAIIAYGPANGATSPTDPAFIGIKNLKITDNIIWSNAMTAVTQTAVNSSTVVKIMTSKNALIENNESYANAGPGFWLDGRNFGYTIRSTTSTTISPRAAATHPAAASTSRSAGTARCAGTCSRATRTRASGSSTLRACSSRTTCSAATGATSLSATRIVGQHSPAGTTRFGTTCSAIG